MRSVTSLSVFVTSDSYGVGRRPIFERPLDASRLAYAVRRALHGCR